MNYLLLTILIGALIFFSAYVGYGMGVLHEAGRWPEDATGANGWVNAAEYEGLKKPWTGDVGTCGSVRFHTPQVTIDMGAIIQIESSGNPTAVSSAGCRGLCQIAEGTWNECCERLGKDWDWKTDGFDPGINRLVGNYYMNTRIPQMLDHYKVPDTVNMRLAAYNWGIGNLLQAYLEYGAHWPAYTPKETRDYLTKYERLVAKAR